MPLPPSRRARRNAPKPPAAGPAAAAEAPRIDALTGLRGVAALLVFGFHLWTYAGGFVAAGTARPLAPPALEWLFQLGWSGVDVFFTLSAFLLAMPFAEAARRGGSGPDLATYLQRRVLRIFPAYHLQLAILLACSFSGLGVGSVVLAWPGWGDAFAQALLWFHLWPPVFPMLAPWWTLPVEFGFYLLLPLLAVALRPGRWPWLLLLLPLSWGWRTWWIGDAAVDPSHYLWAEHLPGRIDQFAIGMLAAYAAVAWRDSPRWNASAWRNALLLAGATAFLLLPVLLLDAQGRISQGLALGPGLRAWHTGASLAVAAMLLACAAGAPLARWLLASRPAVALGQVSYSLYLWHVPVILWVHGQSGASAMADGGGFWGFASVCLLLSLAVATASWWLVERPALRWGARRQGKLPA